jgi:hypothetical protein
VKALCWQGKGDMRRETVPDTKIQDPRRLKWLTLVLLGAYFAREWLAPRH